MRLCRLCKVKPVSAARAKWSDYRCDPCRNRAPSSLAAKARYDDTPRGQAKAHARNQRTNARRIWVGRQYHSAATSAEQAQIVNAHIKERVLAFKQGQQDGKKAQGTEAG
jgi:hypothetical protein